ncbi:DUF5060 domain-containing protein [Sesbania bispinosa]|nr:DUF5060 domain-containing protein [Sesbania bispinosa]
MKTVSNSVIASGGSDNTTHPYMFSFISALLENLSSLKKWSREIEIDHRVHCCKIEDATVALRRASSFPLFMHEKTSQSCLNYRNVHCEFPSPS